MDWKVFLTTFGIVFVAELGDKTQLAAMALAGRSGRPVVVFLAASLALVAITLLGVAAGAALRKALPERSLGIASAVLFLVVGTVLLVRSLRGGAGGSS